MPRPGNLQAVLAAAIKVFESEGMQRLTLERVATQAKMSKGGVLYHFAKREHLIAAIALKAAGERASLLTHLALTIKPADLDLIFMLQLARMLLPVDSPGYPKTTGGQAG